MRICIYGASSNEIDKRYIEETEELGFELAKRGHSLVFGGGTNGLMGAAARGFTKGGGEIVGVAPKFFNVDGILYDKCTELIRPNTMRERKQILEDRSDAFVVVPGGIGTFDEFFEILTLKQLGRHNKPVAVYNINGYYDAMGKMIDTAIDGGFMREACREIFGIISEREEIIEYIEAYKTEAYEVNELKNI